MAGEGFWLVAHWFFEEIIIFPLAFLQWTFTPGTEIENHWSFPAVVSYVPAVPPVSAQWDSYLLTQLLSSIGLG